MSFFNEITVTELDMVSTSSIRQSEHYIMKNRSVFGLCIAQDGQNIYHQNGRHLLSDREHVIFYPQGVSYEWDNIVPGHFHMINFYGSCNIPQTDLISMKLENADGLIEEHAVLKRLFLFEGKQSRAEMLSITYRILSALAGYDHLLPALPVLNPAIRYLEKHYNDPSLCNDQLAAQANISEVQFRRLFRNAYGVTPGLYIQKIRLCKAKEMLTGGYSTVTEIAAAAGYASVYHFCRIFREKTGFTPTAYRKKFSRVVL